MSQSCHRISALKEDSEMMWQETKMFPMQIYVYLQVYMILSEILN